MRGTEDKLSCLRCFLCRVLFHLYRGEISVQSMLLPEDCEGMVNQNHPQNSSHLEDSCASTPDNHTGCVCVPVYPGVCAVFLTLNVSGLMDTILESGLSLHSLQMHSPCAVCLQLCENVNELISKSFKAGCRTVKNTDKSCYVKTCRQICHLAHSLSHWPPAQGRGCSISSPRGTHSASSEQQGKKYLSWWGHNCQVISTPR